MTYPFRKLEIVSHHNGLWTFETSATLIVFLHTRARRTDSACPFEGGYNRHTSLSRWTNSCVTEQSWVSSESTQRGQMKPTAHTPRPRMRTCVFPIPGIAVQLLALLVTCTTGTGILIASMPVVVPVPVHVYVLECTRVRTYVLTYTCQRDDGRDDRSIPFHSMSVKLKYRSVLQ